MTGETPMELTPEILDAVQRLAPKGSAVVIVPDECTVIDWYARQVAEAKRAYDSAALAEDEAKQRCQEARAHWSAVREDMAAAVNALVKHHGGTSAGPNTLPVSADSIGGPTK